jgi:two-component system sensor histidine kinase KdpD
MSFLPRAPIIAEAPETPLKAPPAPPAALVLVAVKYSHEAPVLMEAGRRLAARLGGRWVILHIDTLDSLHAPESERHSLTETLRAADSLGGESTRIPADDVTTAIAAYARARSIKHIVIGASRPRSVLRPYRKSVAERLSAACDGMWLQFVATTPGPPQPSRLGRHLFISNSPLRSYAISLALVAGATFIALSLVTYVAETALSVVFLTAVLIAATEFGLGPALFTSILSMLSFDFFLLTPVYSFSISSAEDLTAFATFGVAALFASRFATRVREQVHLSSRRAAEASDLYQLTRGLAGAATLDQVSAVVAARASAAIDRPVAVLLATPGAQALPARAPLDAPFSAEDLAAARVCLASPTPGGAAAQSRSKGGWRFLRLLAAERIVGVVCVLDPGRPLEIEKEHRLNIIAEQVAISIDRINLATDLDRERQRDATDRLHAALLASISHDLRDPLTAILGSAQVLDERWGHLPAAVSAELIQTVREEAERMDLLVHNLLDMARLEGRAFRAGLKPTYVGDVVEVTLRRTERLIGHVTIALDIPPDLPCVTADPVLLEQVLFNLIDNAAQYAPAGSVIQLGAVQRGRWVQIQVADEGPGFPPEHIDRIFDKFFRASHPRRRKGAGLGLAICLGFVEAMQGEITASNRPGRSGAIVEIRLPITTVSEGLTHDDE